VGCPTSRAVGEDTKLQLENCAAHPCPFPRGRLSALSELLVGLPVAANPTWVRGVGALPCKPCGACPPSEGFSPGMSQEVVSCSSVSARAIEMLEVVILLAGQYPRASRDSAPHLDASRGFGWNLSIGSRSKRRKQSISLTLVIPWWHQCFKNK